MPIDLKQCCAVALIAVATRLPAIALAATDVDDEVMAVTQAACDAFRNRDLPALESLLAPDFELVGSDGVAQPRSQAIDEVRAGEPRYDVFRNHGMSARVDGEARSSKGSRRSAARPAAGRSRWTCGSSIRSSGPTVGGGSSRAA